MRKNEICWAIFSGKTMLPFTIRTTRTQCVIDYGGIRAHETCKKVVINEWMKTNQ